MNDIHKLPKKGERIPLEELAERFYKEKTLSPYTVYVFDIVGVVTNDKIIRDTSQYPVIMVERKRLFKK